MYLKVLSIHGVGWYVTAYEFVRDFVEAVRLNCPSGDILAVGIVIKPEVPKSEDQINPGVEREHIKPMQIIIDL